MSSCEICGGKASVKAIVEGVELAVCEECAKLGKIVHKKEETKRKVEKKPEVEETIVIDYASRIRKVREKNKLTQEEFAKLLNERLSVIKKIEHGELVPSLKLARKIEEKFKIKLIELQAEVYGEPVLESKIKSVTIGDLAKIRKRKTR